MTQIPAYWFFISAVCFVFNILLFITLIGAILVILKYVKEAKPRIEALETSVQGLVAKVQSAAETVERVAENLNETVQQVGGRAKNVVGSAELAARSANTQIDRFSPIVAGVVTAMRVIGAINDFRNRGNRGAVAAAKGSSKRAEIEDEPRKSRGIALFKR